MKKLGLNMHVGRPGDTDTSKTVAIFFPKRNGTSQGDKRRNEMADEPGNPCYVNFVDYIKYLGSIIDSSLSCERDILARLKTAQMMFGALSKDIMRNNWLNLKVKGQIFRALILSVLLYGSECWTLTADLYKQLRNFFNSSVRKMCRSTYWRTTKRERIHSWELRERVGLRSFDDYYVSRLLRWAGKVQRMPMSRLPKLLWSASMTLPKGSGNRSTYHQTVKAALKAVGYDVKGDKDWAFAASDLKQWDTETRVVQEPFYAESSKFKKTELERLE